MELWATADGVNASVRSWVRASRAELDGPLYRAVAGRLGLADWQRQIDAKLRSVSEIYRVLQDQAQYARAETLELIIIALIAVEAVIGVLALRH